jgi:integral membrane protein
MFGSISRTLDMPRLLTTYRVMTYVTGIVLLALLFVAVPLNHLADNPGPSAVIGPLHGFLYAVYVVIVLLLGYARRWSLWRTFLVLIAGTVPFAAFFAEHRIVADARSQVAGEREHEDAARVGHDDGQNTVPATRD